MMWPMEDSGMSRLFASFLGAVVMSALPLLFADASAQSYPNKPILLVSPYGVGGNADLAARALAHTASRYLDKQVVVFNRVGAGGVVGSQYVLDSAPDGYILLLARVGSQAVAPALDPATPYKWNSFTMIGMLELDPYVCVVSGKSKIKTADALIAFVKDRGGKANYASTGAADASVVFPVKMFLNAGLKADAAAKIPYKGAGDTVSAVLGGHVDFACNGMAPYTGAIKSGDLRALVVSTKSRVPEAPETPTAAEIGMPNLETVSGWSALYGPPGLPKHVIAKWASVLSKLKGDPEWVSAVRKRGSMPNVMSADETRQFVESQYSAYRALAPQIGIGK
jgi:tripartite-type tricarboxylate transporter receptor subunit TctC